METFICTKCKIEKLASEFAIDKHKKKGRVARCKICIKEAQRIELPPIINLPGEIWNEVVGYNGQYKVSTCGRIKGVNRFIRGKNGASTLKREKLLVPNIDKYGYYKASLQNKGTVTRTIHRLVAIAFIPNPDNKPTVNHINGIKIDNRVENLEWATWGEQIQHAFNTGLAKRGEGMAGATLKNADIPIIRKMYADGMRICDIMKHFPTSRDTIARVVHNRRWIHF